MMLAKATVLGLSTGRSGTKDMKEYLDLVRTQAVTRMLRILAKYAGDNGINPDRRMNQMEAHKENRTFSSGAVRDGGKKPALQYISPHAMFRLGEWLRFACEDRQPEPYPPRNWEKGLPFSETIASLQRHVEKFKLGDTEEDHIAAILFGGMALAHYEEEIKAGRLPADLDDMPHYLGRGVQRVRNGTDGVIRGGTLVTHDSGNVCPLEQKVQADLDATFKNPDMIYAAEDISKGAHFYIWGNEARNRSEAWPGCRLREAYATETIPKGAPIRRVNGQYSTEEIPAYDIHLGAVRQGPDGTSQTFVRIMESPEKVPPIMGGPKISRRIAKRPPFTVYLCGPITGQKIDYEWRERATTVLKEHGIKTLDPLRSKKPKDISDQGLGYKGQLAAPEIAERDKLDIKEADAVLACFPYMPPRQSIGSLMEMGAAAIGFEMPVILTAGAIKVFNEHLFCRNFCTIEPDFEQALARIVAMAAAQQR